MKSISTSKLPGRSLGNLALAGSLFLHVGLIAFFSSWQWDGMPLEKDPPKIVQVKFIPDTQSSQTTEMPKSSKPASIPPTRPLTTQPNSKSQLIPRTPTLSTPPLPPIAEARQLLPSPSKIIKPLLSQSSSFANSPLYPAAIPVSTHAAGQSKVVQHRLPIRQGSFSKELVTFSKTAFAMKMPTSGTDPIHPLTDPIQSRPETLTLINGPAAQTPKQYDSPKSPETLHAALPRKLSPSIQQEREGTPIDLGNLRGLFTGKVRQRIANAKYYPRMAKRRGMEGQPIIAFTLGRQGQLTKAALVKTSGYQVLDQAALKAVHQAAPYPEIPAELKIDTFQFKLPVSFILK
jgi:TonB family protein